MFRLDVKWSDKGQEWSLWSVYASAERAVAVGNDILGSNPIDPRNGAVAVAYRITPV